MAEINDRKYYEYRKEIHKLYKNDTRMNGDICSRILELRDTNKFIEYIDMAIQDYSISLEVSEDTPIAKTNEIILEIFTRLSEFIRKNVDELSGITDMDEFETFTEPSNYLLADVMVLGTSISFSL